MIFCNECIHFGVCMGFYKCKRFERRENANMRITGYEVDGGKLPAVYITDETRGIEQKKYVEDRPHGEWIYGECWSEGIGMGETYGQYKICPFCGYKAKEEPRNFCQKCGADMRPKEGEEE